jgi:hypothetical protein
MYKRAIFQCKMLISDIEMANIYIVLVNNNNFNTNVINYNWQKLHSTQNKHGRQQFIPLSYMFFSFRTIFRQDN